MLLGQKRSINLVILENKKLNFLNFSTTQGISFWRDKKRVLIFGIVSKKSINGDRKQREKLLISL